MQTAHPMLRSGLAFTGLTAALLLIAGPAAANGRTPPQPAGTGILTAACEERAGGARHEIVRVRVAGEGVAEDSLDIRTGDAWEKVTLARLQSLEIGSDALPDVDGAVDAIVRRGTEAAPAAVAVDAVDAKLRVQAGPAKAPIRLVGFRPDGTRVAVDLSACRQVTFAGSPPANRPPPTGLGPKAD